MTETKVSTNRYMTQWMALNQYSFIVTSYSHGKIFSIGTNNGQISVWETPLARPMGLCCDKNNLYMTNMGHIFQFINMGTEKDPDHGTFDANFYPKLCHVAADVDIHDLRLADNQLYYCSVTFNCVCKPSMRNTFETHWVPPWIKFEGRLPGEDRCHLNGLCCVDGVPRYITSVGQGNVAGSWRKNNNGVVYDIVENKKLCEGLISPHSPTMYNGKLWLLETGTGQLGYVEDGEFHKKKFLPGFLRGLTFIDNYAVVCSSLDRHDTSFDKIPLGQILAENDAESMCGLFIVDMDTFDQVHTLTFLSGATELYDVSCLKGVSRPRVHSVNDPKLMNVFHVDTRNDSKKSE